MCQLNWKLRDEPNEQTILWMCGGFIHPTASEEKTQSWREIDRVDNAKGRMTGYCVHYLVQDEERGESPILLQFYCGSKNRGNKEGRVMIKGYCNLFWLLKKRWRRWNFSIITRTTFVIYIYLKRGRKWERA